MVRTYVFIDGQSVFHQARACFGYKYANYDPVELAKLAVGLEPRREFNGFFFYTGVHKAKFAPNLRTFWDNKIKAIRRKADNERTLEIAKVFTRPLLYNEEAVLDKKTGEMVLRDIGREKGIDLRLTLDAVRNARLGNYDVIIIFSQDSDLTEAAREIRDIGRSQNRNITIESAYPFSDSPVSDRISPYGIPGTVQRKINRADYDSCIDPFTHTYWPKPKGQLPYP